jgi:hypothetical protein
MTAVAIRPHAPAQRLYTTRTTPAQQRNRAYGHCAPALRAGALLASPDAQTALSKAFEVPRIFRTGIY